MRRCLRVVLAVTFVLLAVSAPSWAATPREPYKIAPTRTCLAQHGAHLLAAKRTYPHQIEWLLATAASYPVAIEIEFSRNPKQAAAYERKIMYHYRGEGLSGSWIRRHLFRRQNVVVHPDVASAHVAASRVRTILRCLRR